MKFLCIYAVVISELLLTSGQVMAVELATQTAYFQKIVKTAKERLGKKSSDPQRVNNCKVPIEKRGSKPRPDQCHRNKR
jgi:hypothetical protein